MERTKWKMAVLVQRASGKADVWFRNPLSSNSCEPLELVFECSIFLRIILFPDFQ